MFLYAEYINTNTPPLPSSEFLVCYVMNGERAFPKGVKLIGKKLAMGLSKRPMITHCSLQMTLTYALFHSFTKMTAGNSTWHSSLMNNPGLSRVEKKKDI